jgi:hypothetical protein
MERPSNIHVDISSLTESGINSASSEKPKRTRAGRPKAGPSGLHPELETSLLQESMAQPPKKTTVSKEQIDYLSKGMKLTGKVKGVNLEAGNKDEDEKERLYVMICKYHDRFQEKLGKMPKMDLSKKSTIDLKGYLASIQAKNNSSFGDFIAKSLFSGLMYTIENIYQTFAYNQPWNKYADVSMYGLHHVCMQSYEEFRDEIDEIKILYPQFFEHGVWSRLIQKIVQKGVQVGGVNSSRGAANSEADANLMAEAADL